MAGLDDKTNQVLQDIGRVIAEQVALIESLQTHAEAINTQISALHTGHDQLNSNVSGLHELGRTVVDGVTTISNEQVGVHEALQENTQALAGNTHIVEQQQKNLQEEINKVAETGQQIVATDHQGGEKNRPSHFRREFCNNTLNELYECHRIPGI